MRREKIFDATSVFLMACAGSLWFFVMFPSLCLAFACLLLEPVTQKGAS